MKVLGWLSLFLSVRVLLRGANLVGMVGQDGRLAKQVLIMSMFVVDMLFMSVFVKWLSFMSALGTWVPMAVSVMLVQECVVE